MMFRFFIPKFPIEKFNAICLTSFSHSKSFMPFLRATTQIINHFTCKLLVTSNNSNVKIQILLNKGPIFLGGQDFTILKDWRYRVLSLGIVCSSQINMIISQWLIQRSCPILLVIIQEQGYGVILRKIVLLLCFLTIYSVR